MLLGIRIFFDLRIVVRLDLELRVLGACYDFSQDFRICRILGVHSDFGTLLGAHSDFRTLLGAHSDFGTLLGTSSWTAAPGSRLSLIGTWTRPAWITRTRTTRTS